MKYKIKLSSKYKEWDWLRQTPERKGVWGDCQFFIDEDLEECDFWFVYEDVFEKERAMCFPQNVFLITGEPETINKYSKRFFAQFERIITSIKNKKFSNITNHVQGQPWRVGVNCKNNGERFYYDFNMDFDDFFEMKEINKSKLISLVSSNKTITSCHIKRIKFVEKLKNHFGHKLDVFGIGFNEVEDKWDAIAPYKYSIVLENSSYDDYWTEKLSDAFLGFSCPIYYGCKNIDKYFDKDAMTVIDINDFKGSVKAIERAISENYYEKYYDKIIEARELVLNKYNVFALMNDFVEKHFVEGEKKLITIYPQKFFEKEPNIFQKAVSKIKRIYKEIVYGIK